jgi:hypothetical protein
MGSVQKDMVKRMRCGIKRIKRRRDETVTPYPISNPVDSATSKAAQNEQWEQGNLSMALMGGRSNEEVSRPQASARRMT